MAQKTQPFDRDQFLEEFKRGMDQTIEHIFDRIGGDDGGREDRDKPSITTSGSKPGGCIFHIELDQSALAKMSDDDVRGYLETDCVDMMLGAIQTAKSLANSIKKSAPRVVSRGGEGGCSVSKEGGGPVKGECHVSWHF